jgi:cation diffusion facilitator CzcD-associated flavoprotein CzcO
VLARRVILATGYDSNGAWHIPEFLSEALPPEVCRHSNHVIDFDALRGKRIGILGHGASAFDTALAALRHGAHSVDLCFRRRDLPRVNPHRWAEFAGFLKHFPELDDATRWAVAHFFDTADQPPARHSFDAACAQAHLKIHAATPWTRASYEGGAIHIETPSGAFVFDQVIAATGSKADLHLRRELRDIVDGIALWRDRYTPPEDLAHPALGHYPYLGHHYEFTAREPGAAPYLTHLYAYNFSSFVSCGPHSTSISGHKHALPRLIRGVTGSLFREQSASLLPSVKAYDEVELDLPVRDIAPRTGIQL